MTPKTRTTAEDREREQTIASIRAAVDQLTRPVRVVVRYRIDPADAAYLEQHDQVASVRRKRKTDRRTHVRQLPDILEQLAAATVREKTTARSGSSGGSFESKPAIVLDPLDVYAQIRAEARELLRQTSGRDIAAEATRLRSRLAAAHGHVRRHRATAHRHRGNRVWDLACVAAHASTTPELEAAEFTAAARHLDNLRDRSREASAAADQWLDQIERINAELALAESPRAALLAIAAGVDALGPHHLKRTDEATARWLDLARVAARYDPEPITVDEPCPICRKPNMIEVRGDATSASARCRNPECGAEFTRDQMATFKRLVRTNQAVEALAQDEATAKVDAAIADIEKGMKLAGLSKAELARRAEVSDTMVYQVLNRKWPASKTVLGKLARAVAEAIPVEATP